MIPPWGIIGKCSPARWFRAMGIGYLGSVRPSPARAAFAALALATGLGLGTAACTKEKAQPAAPPSSAAPTGGAETSPNSVPPGVSGEGSKGGTGQGQSTP